MAVDMFLKLDGIKGESEDSKRKEQIDVLAWSWGASNSGSTHMGGGSGSGKANFQDISITKYVDKSSPTLLQFVSGGKHIATGQLVVRKAGDKPLEYMIIDIEDIIITSYSTGGSGGEDRLTENLTLNFAKFKFSYVPQAKDGSGGAAVECGYDIKGNEAK